MLTLWFTWLDSILSTQDQTVCCFSLTILFSTQWSYLLSTNSIYFRYFLRLWYHNNDATKIPYIALSNTTYIAFHPFSYTTHTLNFSGSSFSIISTNPSVIVIIILSPFYLWGIFVSINTLVTSTPITSIYYLSLIATVMRILSFSAVGIDVYSLVIYTHDCLPLNTSITLISPLLFSVGNIIASRALLLSYVVISLTRTGSNNFRIYNW